MYAVAISLKDLVIDPEKAIDLTALPEAEAIDLIIKSYGFVPSSIDVSIRNGVATICLREAEPEKAEEVHSSGEG